jgi:agmatine deiminase
MPGEFEPHVGCWMLWPERSDNWRGGARPAQRAFAAVAAAIAAAEPVTVCVSRAQYPAARAALPQTVRLVEMSSNDSWIRDCGPTFLVGPGGEVRGVDWSFNAWGGPSEGLYAQWDQDDLVGEKVLEIEREARYAPSLVLEGGSIEVDGEGTLITTEQCLLNPNRNPGKTRADIEWHLREYLAVERIIWLGEGVYQDETAGHVDNLCRFVRPGSWRSRGRTTRTIRSMRSRGTRTTVSPARRTRRAGNSRSTRSTSPSHSTSPRTRRAAWKPFPVRNRAGLETGCRRPT